jgi:thiamine-phosphate pyrophosphorylase
MKSASSILYLRRDALLIRKPDFQRRDDFLTEIRLEYRNRLVLHSHHNLKALAIHRLHFTENNRNAVTRKQLETCKKQDFTLSTSTHSIEDFNELDPAFDYAL